MKKGAAHCKITEWQVMDKKKDKLTLRSTRNFIPPLWYKGEGGGWNPSPDMLQYFKTILPLVESL